MAVRTIVGTVVETESIEEDQVVVAIETELDTYFVHPPEMAEELTDLIGHRIEATGAVSENEHEEPVIEVESYVELYDEDEFEDEEEEEETGTGRPHLDDDEDVD